MLARECGKGKTFTTRREYGSGSVGGSGVNAPKNTHSLEVLAQISTVMPEYTEACEESRTGPSVRNWAERGPVVGLLRTERTVAEVATTISTERDAKAEHDVIHSGEEGKRSETIRQRFQDDQTRSNPSDNHQQSAPSILGDSDRMCLPEIPRKIEGSKDMPNGDSQRVEDQGQHPLAARQVFGDPNSISRTIHILGTGTVSSFIAHSLADSAGAPPITLLLRSDLLMQQWYDEGGVIRVVKNDMIDSKSGLNVEFSGRFLDKTSAQRVSESEQSLQLSARPLPNVIENLIVTTEGSATISALSALKHRLRSFSTVCFIQDGLGIVDHVDSSVFPRPGNRPSYILGNISHDLQPVGSIFTVRERRPGTLSLTIIPQRQDTSQVRRLDYGWTVRSKYLVRTLCQASGLNAQGFLPQDFYKMQLERLAINSILGPLSVMYHCTNDQLLYNYQISRTMKLLIKEISMILQHLPEVSHISDITQHFSPERLEILVLSVIGKTGTNRTTMLQAVIDGRKTNIDFHNGYLIDRAASLGIGCPNLEMVTAMVKGKQAMTSRERNFYIPFTDKK